MPCGQDRMRVSERVRRGCTAEQVARAVLRAYDCNATEAVVPWGYRILIGLTVLAPFIIDFGLKHMMRPEE